MYNRKDYENFLTTELETQVREYERLIKTRALVLKERGEIFVGRFLKFNEKNIAIFKIKVTDNMPLANSFWTATHFVGEMGNFNNWGNNSWENLRDNYQKDFSEAQCIWISKSLEDNKYCLVGIKNLSLTFAKTIQEETPIIAFGPQDPPLQYLLNLIDIVRDESSSAIQSILNYKKVVHHNFA